MNRRAAFLFIALGIAWGIPYMLIKVSVAEISPAMLVLARTVLGAALLLPIAFAQGAVIPVLRRWKPLLVFTLLEIAIPWLFLNHAEQSLPSSTTGLLISAVPLVGATLALVTRRSSGLTAKGWLGLAIGLVGVVALVGLDVQGSDRLAAASLVVVAVGYALGPWLLSGPLAGLPGIGIVSVAITGVALMYLPIVLFSGQFPASVPSGSVIVSVIILAVVCTAAAFLMLFELTALVGPVRVTAITYLNPAVSVLAGAAVLSEPITVWTILGFVLVLAGAYLITARPSSAAVTDHPPVPVPVPAGPEAAVAQGCAEAALPPVSIGGVPPVAETRMGTSVTRT